MAQSASLYRWTLNIQNDHDQTSRSERSLSLMRHPSESIERMIARLLAYLDLSHTPIEFASSICHADEPDLWQKADNGRVYRWVNVGLLTPHRLKKIQRKATYCHLYTYQHTAEKWWHQYQQALLASQVQIKAIHSKAVEQLAANVQRTNHWQVNIQTQSLSVEDENSSIEVELACWHQPPSFLESHV